MFSWVRYRNRDQRKKFSFPYLHRCTEVWRCQAGGQRRCWRALGLGRAFRAGWTGRAPQTSPGRTNLFLVIISTWTYLDVVVCPADARGEPLSQTLHLATEAGLLEKIMNKVFGFIRNLCLASNTKKYKLYLGIIRQNWQVQPATRWTFSMPLYSFR